MGKYFVRTIEIEPVVTVEESELIDSLPFVESIEGRFPFDGDDLERNKLEAYRIGSHTECKKYINDMNVKIKHLFKIEKLD